MEIDTTIRISNTDITSVSYSNLFWRVTASKRMPIDDYLIEELKHGAGEDYEDCFIQAVEALAGIRTNVETQARARADEMATSIADAVE